LSVLLGPFLIEQMVGTILYSVIFPLALHYFGPAESLLWGFVVQVIGSFIFIYVCDRSSRDIFNLQEIKRKFRARFPSLHADTDDSKEGKVRAFLIFCWKCTPPMVLLLMRKGGEKGHPMREVLLVFLAIIGATLYSVGLKFIAIDAGRWGLLVIAVLVLWPIVKKRWKRLQNKS
jgi:hypothetical protein